MKGLSKTVRLFRDVYALLKRIQMFLSEQENCPQLRSDTNDLLEEVQKFISI